MSILMVGWPSSGGTWMSVMPRTFSSTPRISTAILRSVSRSGPVILMAFSASMPDAASCTLSWMYCEKPKVVPGKPLRSASPISAISCSLVRPLRHLSAGFSGTKNSTLEKPSGSVPSSGLPCWVMTVSTSGKLLTSRRMRLA